MRFIRRDAYRSGIFGFIQEKMAHMMVVLYTSYPSGEQMRRRVTAANDTQRFVYKLESCDGLQGKAGNGDEQFY